MLKAFFIFLFSIFYIFNIVVYKIMPVYVPPPRVPQYIYSSSSGTRRKNHSRSSPSSPSSERNESAPAPPSRQHDNMVVMAEIAAQAAAMAVVGAAYAHVAYGRGKRRKGRSAAYKSRKRNIRRH